MHRCMAGRAALNPPMSVLLPPLSGIGFQRTIMNSTHLSYRCHASFMATIAMLLLCAASAVASSPDLNLIRPRGGQRGTEVEVNFHGNRLNDAQEILMYREGVTVQSLEVVNDKHVKVKATIAADATPGEVGMRVRTATGVSDLHTYHIGLFPIIDEVEENGEFNAPQMIQPNHTVHGVVKNEDVDYYAIEARQGERITAEIDAMRLGRNMFDPYIAILDAARFELAVSDDTPLLKQDGHASIIAPKDGLYVIMVRETSYGGNDSFDYRLHVGHFPRPKMLYPAGGQAGQDLQVHVIGDVAGDFDTTIKLPETPNRSHGVFIEHNGQTPTSSNIVSVRPYRNALEVEPNGDRNNNGTVVEGDLPVALNGIIQQEDDEDYFRINAKKGQAYHIRVLARSLGSPLDPVMNIFAPDGKHIEGNDDAVGPDSYMRFTFPEDGQYAIRVRDHLRAGGPDYVYRVEIEPIAPDMDITLPEFNRNRQDRHTIVVPRGNRYSTLMRTTRRDFGGQVKLWAENLPAGVSMHCPPVHQSVTEWPVMFEATGDAAIAGTLATIQGGHIENEGIRGQYAQSINLVYGNPNNTVFYGTSVDKLAVAVAEESPFKLSIVQPKVPIVRDGEMQLKVVAERKEGFDEEIVMHMPFQPSGVSASNQVKIPKGQNEAIFSLNANGGAALGKWPIVVLGYANVNGPLWVSTPYAELEVAEPFIGMKIDMAAAEQGKPAVVVGKIDNKKPYDGNATVELLGLPAKTATENQQVTKDSAEVTFNVTTEADSPKGQHKSLFCKVTITQNGEPIVHRVAYGSVLRIDPPPPAPAKPEPKKEEPKKEEPKPQEPQPKPLSRLEKLRIEAEKARENQ